MSTDPEAAAKAAREVPLQRQVAAVERELSYRRGVYPRLVAAGKLTERQAAAQTYEMVAVLGTLLRVRGAVPEQETLL